VVARCLPTAGDELGEPVGGGSVWGPELSNPWLGGVSVLVSAPVAANVATEAETPPLAAVETKKSPA